MLSAICSWFCFLFCFHASFGDYTITIHPQLLAQGGRSHFEVDRWDGHNGLDTEGDITRSKQIGTQSGRWIHEDYSNMLFQKAPQDPHRKGYADPKYFLNHQHEEHIGKKYLSNIKGYGFDLDTVMELKEKNWPHWMNTSLHKGKFPNNLDAGADMVLLLLEAVSQYTGGHVPPYFEVINEPGTLWETVNWATVLEYHKIVNNKLKKKFPNMKVGGPTNTGAIANADHHDFKIWKHLKAFMDMSLNLLDFFSFHAYNHYNIEGSTHVWSGINEARLFAVIDLIECYSWQKKGKSVPLIVSEYGLGGDNVKIATPSSFDQWAFAFMHNAQMFTYLNFRGDMDRAIAFILGHSVNFASASLYRNHDFTNVAKAYQFWQHFNDTHQFLRVDSDFDGNVREISPLAMVNPHTKEIDVLVHNYQQAHVRVKLVFDKNWTHASSAKSTCFFLNSHKVPVLNKDQTVTLTDNAFTIPAEASCYISVKSNFNFGSIPILHEHPYYANGMVLPITHNVVDTTVTVPVLGHILYSYLRVGVSYANKASHTKPTSVHLNGHTLSSSYTLFAPGKQYSDTVWDVYVYQVPVHILQQHSNTVRLHFAQNGGYVSTVALFAGKVPGGTTVIG